MTVLAYGLILFLLALGAKGTHQFSPEASEDLFGEKAPSVLCRDETASERENRNGGGLGKVSQFSLTGQYRCERRIFDYGDRWPFVDLVMDAAALEAQRVGQSAVALLVSKPKLKDYKWFVEVSAPDNLLIEQLTIVFQNALFDALGPGAVVRSKMESEAYMVMQITVRPVKDPSILFASSAHVEDARIFSASLDHFHQREEWSL